MQEFNKVGEVMNADDLERAINESCFPPQLGFKQLLQSAGIRWRLALRENPWRDPISGDDKFLDMAVSDESGQIPVIECKRAHHTAKIFLRE